MQLARRCALPLLLLVALSGNCCWVGSSARREGHGGGAFGGRDPSTCTPPLYDPSKLWAGDDKWHCRELRQTCIEQGGFVVYDKLFVEDNPFAKNLPSWDFKDLKYHHRHHNPWIRHEKETVHGNTLYYTVIPEKIVVRLPTKQEWVRNRSFSNCTMPIVFFENWQHNPTEFMQRSPSISALSQLEGAWDMNSTIVMAMPGGIDPLTFAPIYLQAFSNYKVTTLTRFSEPSRSRHTRSASTWEGVPVRCFHRIVVCTLITGMYRGMYTAGQRIYEHYKPVLPAANPKGGTFFSAAPNKLKVLFERRPTCPKCGDMRQIINLEELLTTAATYAWDFDPSSSYDGVEFRSHTFGRTLLDIAVMREVDVFITLHSAGSMHGHFMRQHSSFIELRPFEFGTKHPFMAKMVWPSVCPAIRFDILCWFMNLDEEGSWTPGVYEKYNITNESGGSPTMRARDRNIVVKIEWLALLLRKVVKTNRNVTLYKERWDNWTVAYTFVNKTVITGEKHIW